MDLMACYGCYGTLMDLTACYGRYGDVTDVTDVAACYGRYGTLMDLTACYGRYGDVTDVTDVRRTFDRRYGCSNKVWDTAGEERFKSMAPMYYRNANAAMLVFDVTRYNSFTAIKNWVTELKRNVEEQMVLTVIGNKSDLFNDREVDSEEGRFYATKIGATYHETSVLHNDGIENVFLAIAKGLIDLSSGNTQIISSLRISDSNSFGFNNSGIIPYCQCNNVLRI
ncbi:hypothetical protein HZH66_008320 [Vespula vulgaris]|uniref:Uncharacterized protein n=1 Tax=Vespula vulgaris TaxID=7454 RepID=A0A834K0V2_VESVU|nr:hypothetical protein HZH66_008320 [Vespula vulgaris]